MTCLASIVLNILKGYEHLNVNHVTQATHLLQKNFSFMVSTDLINNCDNFEVCSSSDSKHTARKPENAECEENVK